MKAPKTTAFRRAFAAAKRIPAKPAALRKARPCLGGICEACNPRRGWEREEMIPLAGPGGAGYYGNVVATAATGRGNPMHVRRTSATNGVFFRLQFINGGRCGEAVRLAGVLTGRISTPAFVRRSRCGKRSGGLQIQLGAVS